MGDVIVPTGLIHIFCDKGITIISNCGKKIGNLLVDADGISVGVHVTTEMSSLV